MSVRLKPKHEHFCKLIRDGLTGRAAYQKAYTRPGYVPTERTADVQASRLLSSVKVIERITELHEQRAAISHVTLESLTRELWNTAAEARALEQLGAATSAYGLIAKMHGLLIDKQQIDLTVISKPMASPTHEIDLSPQEWASRWSRPLLSHAVNGQTNGHGKDEEDGRGSILVEGTKRAAL